MARGSGKSDDLAVVTARRDALLAELAQAEEQVKVVEQAARDAGRPTLLAALGRTKIAAMEKADAKTIADAIGLHGGKIVAERLTSLGAA